MSVGDPSIRAAYERIPELETLVREVDRSLIAWSLGLTPFERLRLLNARARSLARFRHDGSSEDR